MNDQHLIIQYLCLWSAIYPGTEGDERERLITKAGSLWNQLSHGTRTYLNEALEMAYRAAVDAGVARSAASALADELSDEFDCGAVTNVSFWVRGTSSSVCIVVVEAGSASLHSGNRRASRFDLADPELMTNLRVALRDVVCID